MRMNIVSNDNASEHDNVQSEEEKIQQKIWETIAEGWSSWRQAPLKEVEILAKEWKAGSVLDIGCGNGRNLIPFAMAGFDCHGIDFSRRMIDLARGHFKRKGLDAEFRVASATRLPYRANTFDYCISVAVFHHLESEKERAKALSEMKRVLKPGGRALITVWNKLQLRFLLSPKDTYIAWRRKGKIYQRYYHLFDYWELKQMLTKAGFAILKSGGLFDKNLMFIVEKI
jgi:tRNA (uracil-5-)-methyltransferase TRM9